MTFCKPEDPQPKTVARTSSVPPQAECIEMDTTLNRYHSASRVARTSNVPPQAECIEMDIVFWK
jgi:hypothetical protein